MTASSISTAVRTHKALAILMAVALSIGAVGIVGAATPTSTNTMYACVNKTTRVARIVGASRPCRSGEVRKSWNKIGPVGPAGAAGAQGPVGPEGPQGHVGSAGADGVDGAAGIDGTNGVDGADGTDGLDGAQGPVGPEGPQGPVGPEGPQGPVGPEGPQGPEGPAGADGAVGPEGPKGDQGDVGPQGPAGSIGASHIVTGSMASHDKNTISDTVSVSCDSGEVVLGGGGLMTTTDSADTIQLSSSYPSASDEWTVTASGKVAPGKTWTIQAYAICVSS